MSHKDMPTPGHHSADWARRPERSNMLMLRIMTWISLHLGRSAGRVVLHLITAYFFMFAPASRSASRQYLSRVLAHPVRWRDIYRHFFHFAATIHDRIYLINQRFDLFDIEVHGEAQIEQVLKDGQGLFLMGSHMGSFEVIRALGRRRPHIRVAMAMYEENARKINDMLAAINPAASQDVVSLGKLDSMLVLHEHLKQGTLVGILADRMLGDNAAREFSFLGAPANFPLGPFRMAALLRRPVFFMTQHYCGAQFFS